MDFTLPDEGDSSGLVRPDVRIEGNNLTIIHVSVEQPVAGTPFDAEVKLREVSCYLLSLLLHTEYLILSL